MSDHVEQPIPRAVLLGAAGLLAFVVVSVTASRLTGLGHTGQVQSAAVSSYELVFRDRADGAIEVVDPTNQRVVSVVQSGSNGFMRGTLRGLARERKRSSADLDMPFRLTRFADGRLTLEDPTTGRRIDLEAFGPTNAQSFARLIAGEGNVAAR